MTEYAPQKGPMTAGGPIKRLGGDEGRALLESLRDDPTFGREATALTKRTRKR